jgi:hypothetical protein
MNAEFSEFLAAQPEDRRDAFLGAARRLGTPEQNIEKDFWVTWTLDVLFNGLPQGHPRLLFKGGTSLSKAYGLISRFSEDIDITVFREDLGQPASIEQLEALSRKKRQARLDKIKTACREYIQGMLLAQFENVAAAALTASGIEENGPRVVIDPDDPDGQSLLFWYPSVTATQDDYIRPAVKIESGAKSALDPHEDMTLHPYVADELPKLSLSVRNVTTVVAERTFWDKIIILHGVRKWFENRGVLRQQGQRVSRHYYDVHRMLQSELKTRAVGNRALAVDCAAHARMFFNSPDLGLDTAMPGSFSLSLVAGMTDELRRDYGRMVGMVMGAAPRFEDVMASIASLEAELNQPLRR